MIICPICGSQTTDSSGQCHCTNSYQNELVTHTAVPVVMTGQQYIPGSYPTASPHSQHPVTDEVQRYRASDTLTEISPYYSPLTSISTTIAGTSTSPPPPAPLQIQFPHILAMDHLDDIAKSTEIAKERLLIEIEALQEQLYHLQQNQLQVQNRIQTRDEEDLMTLIDLLSQEYRLLVMESNERSLDQLRLAQKASNGQDTSSSFLSNIYGSLSRRVPRVPNLRDFEPETQRYILSSVTLAMVCAFVFYQRSGGSGSTQKSQLSQSSSDMDHGGTHLDAENASQDHLSFKSQQQHETGTVSSSLLSYASTIANTTKWAYSLASGYAVNRIWGQPEDNGANHSSQSSELLHSQPGDFKAQTRFETAMESGGEAVLDTIADSAYEEISTAIASASHDTNDND